MTSLQTWLRDFLQQGEFLTRYRYYAGILARVEAVENRSIPVMGVSAYHDRFFLHVNTDYFTQPPTNMKYVMGVLLHEVHHMILGHVGTTRFRGATHPHLLDLAMEISANEYIEEPLPGTPPRWQHYKDFGIGPKQSTWDRYHLLVEHAQEIPVGALVDSHLQDGVGAASGNGPNSASGLQARVRLMLEETVAEVQHERELLHNPLLGGTLAGHTPGHWLEELAESTGDTVLDWRQQLRQFATVGRAARHTYSRPNRRLRHLVGIVPGRSHQPDPLKPRRLLVGLDTSGSMGTAELQLIARELRSLSDLVRFTVVECDSTIQRVYPFTGRLRDVAGRGGTDFRPVFAPQFLDEHRPDGVVFFTDGYGPYPVTDPGLPTMWVLTKEWDFPCPWGTQAFLEATG